MFMYPSKIDVLGEDQKDKLTLKQSGAKGEIEFKDVWFRYPTRKEQWVFKGLNLKINANDNIAIVGESGQGKSTLISLLMRFYDPEFGQILIDGEDIKSYNLHDLRGNMGLVMQEPTLFNYNLKENILYGKMNASNQEINDAAAVANALEFIEDKELSQAFDDDAKSLLEAYQSETIQSAVTSAHDEETQKKTIEELQKMIKK
jgi:ATP-binding cassette subfamily B (MDR/TAP) protein 1